MIRTRLLAGAVRAQTWWMLCLSVLAVPAGASSQNGSNVPSVETILARMAQARSENQARFCRYVVRRDYKLFGKERDKTKSQVVADVTFVPPTFKKYAIQQSNGTGLGERVVRRMLEREVEIAKDYRSTDVSADNYSLGFIRQEEFNGQRCYVLLLIPRRKDKNLLRGTIWVDAETYLLRRTEGEPAQPPSWWLRDVHITFAYGDVAGMWLQTASESTAKVRILGQHTMVSRDVSYQIGQGAVTLSVGLNRVLKPYPTDHFDTVESPAYQKNSFGRRAQHRKCNPAPVLTWNRKESYMFIQYLGYQPKLNSRTYSFRVVVPLTQEREFTMSIEKQSLTDDGFKCQDMPDLCYSKLKEDLALEIPENPLPLQMTITDTDLRKYREKHYPAKRKFS